MRRSPIFRRKYSSSWASKRSQPASIVPTQPEDASTSQPSPLGQTSSWPIPDLRGVSMTLYSYRNRSSLITLSSTLYRDHGHRHVNQSVIDQLLDLEGYEL